MTKQANIESMNDRKNKKTAIHTHIYSVGITCPSEEMFDSLVPVLQDAGFEMMGCPWDNISSEGDYGDCFFSDDEGYQTKTAFVKEVRKIIRVWRKS
jgi:hypothetical protein